MERRGKISKAPINARAGEPADSTDSVTWGTFEQALVALAHFRGLAGVEFVFSADDPFAGMDLDGCLDPTTAEMKPWALPIIRQLSSYSEVSPSCKGVKVFVQASEVGTRCKTRYEDGALEI